MGVTTKKKTKPITIGETILPRKIPNLCHSLFNGVKKFELRAPKIKNSTDNNKAHTLNSTNDLKGQKDIIKKTKKNKNPKLLFEETLAETFFIIP